MGTSLQRRQLRLHLFFLIIAINVLTDFRINADRVITEPSEAVLLVNESASLLCHYSQSLQYCRIEIPGGVVLNLSPDWEASSDYSYYGQGLKNNDCGVTIHRVTAKQNGEVKCFLGLQGSEVYGTIKLVVALAPLQPEIEVLTRPFNHDAYNVDQIFRAKCISADGRPAANISWFLDNEPIYHGLNITEIVESPQTALYTTTQEFHRQLTANDDGKILMCRASHIAYRGQVEEASLRLKVKYQPQPLPAITIYGLTLDKTALINITIQANPRPNIEWFIDGIVISQGTQNGRYEAYEPNNLGNGIYNITLSIASLTEEDTTKDYSLRASNNFGYQDYIIKISSAKTPEITGLTAGAVIGIVAAVAILLIVVLLLVFARATGRWCFAGDSLNTDIGPDSEAQINHHSNDNFDGKDYEGIQHIDTKQQTGDETPPVKDKLETQVKNDLKKVTNGHPNGKSNTPV